MYRVYLPTQNEALKREHTSAKQVISPHVLTYIHSIVYTAYIGSNSMRLHNSRLLYNQDQRSKSLRNPKHLQYPIICSLAHVEYFLKMSLNFALKFFANNKTNVGCHIGSSLGRSAKKYKKVQNFIKPRLFNTDRIWSKGP